MRRLRSLLVVATSAAMLMTAFVGVALADKPVVMDKFVDEISGPDPGLAAACGLPEVHASGVVKGTFKLYEDGTIQEHVVGKIEFTGPNGEGPVILSFTRNFSGGDPVSESFDPATGLLTLVFEETFTGKPEQWRAPGVGVIDMDAGFISWTVTVVIDTNTDELVSEEFTDVVVHGPHPIFDNGFVPPNALQICELLGA
jgi:hypothetical protein